MRIRPLVVLSSLAFLSAGPVPPGSTASAAWGPIGHRVVGTIAERLVSASTAAKIAAVLGPETLASISNWADEIRKKPAGAGKEALHYINVPRGALRIDLDRDGNGGNNVVDAIRRYARLLQDESLGREARRDALAFVVHFVGDVHQPLHVSYADDKGGNTVSVAFFDKPTNLHAAWDSSLLERRGGGVDEIAGDLLGGAGPEELAELRSAKDPIEWADESLRITRNDVYRDVESGAVPEAYCPKHIDTVESRLLAAGVRLAALLDSALEKSATPKPVARADASQPSFVESLRAEAAAGQRELPTPAAREGLLARVEPVDGATTTVFTRKRFALAEPGAAAAGGLAAAHLWPLTRLPRRGPARADLYNLRAEVADQAARRGAAPFGLPAEAGSDAAAFALGESAHGEVVARPPASERGAVARAMFYMSLRYDLRIDEDEEAALRAWHAAFPVDARERERADRVAATQGNRNPFIARPDYVSKIRDF